MATLYNKIFSGYQPCQLVKRRKKNNVSKRTEMVHETLVFSPFNHLTRLVSRQYLIDAVYINKCRYEIRHKKKFRYGIPANFDH
jgi:hypothetical protein